MTGDGLPCRRLDGGLAVRVRLTPKGGTDSIEGLTTLPEGPALKVRVRAAPEDGAANAALVSCVANWLGVPKRDVALMSGHKSRSKVVSISGSPDQLEERLKAALASAGK